MSAKVQRTLAGAMFQQMPDNVSSGLFAKPALEVTELTCDFRAIN